MTAIDPLEELFWDPKVTEIMVSAPDDIWVDRHGRIERTGVQFLDEEHLQSTIESYASSDGCRRDGRDPQYYDCILHCDGAPFDGSRVNAVLDETDGHWKLNIRKCGDDNDIAPLIQNIEYDSWKENLVNCYRSELFARMGIGSDAEVPKVELRLHECYRAAPKRK